MKPLLKWAGGKTWLAPTLSKLYDRNLRWVEPFVGGMGATLGVNPTRALLNDINYDLINLYQIVQDGYMELPPWSNTQKDFLKCRDLFNKNLLSHIDSARAFYYLNRTCFNGLCRYNKQGRFNVGYGKYKTVNFIEDFSWYKQQFANWEFTNEDFTKLNVNSDDLIYCDPPYHGTFTTYSKGGFDWDQQVALVKWLVDTRAPVVISNSDTPEIVDLYKQAQFHIQYVSAPRRISCNGDRQQVTEILAFNKEFTMRYGKLTIEI